MRSTPLLLAGICAAISITLSGCAVITVTSAAVSVAGTAVSVGVTAGSAAVGVATTATKGAISVGGAVVDMVSDSE